MAHVRPGVLISVLTLTAFAVYAFFAPATYRSSALIMVEPAGSGAPVSLPEPLEASRRLREAMLDRKMLERLARERASATSPDAQAKAASQVRDALAIDTSDARTFSVSYSDSDAARAQRVCDQLALHGVGQAPLALANADQERAAQLKRQRQTQELAAFLTLHPEVASAPTGDAAPADKDKIDPAMSALRAEKALVERRLAEGAGENPYEDPADSNPEILKRRLIELDAAIAVRKKSLESVAVAPKISPELAAEWRRLVAAVTSVEEEAAPAPRLSAKLIHPATDSIWPVEPNRPLLLFFGIVFGLGFGAAYTLVARATQRRRNSSRPPAGTLADGSRVVVPRAPAMPRLESATTVPVTPIALGATMPLPRPISVAPPANLGSEPPPRTGSEPPRTSPSATPPPMLSAPAPMPSLGVPPAAADPMLVAAAQAWDQAVRTNNVPGFAVVGAPTGRGRESAPPPGAATTPPPGAPATLPPGAPATLPPGPPATLPPSEAKAARMPPRAAHKVTQPLGSFLPDGYDNSVFGSHPSPPPVAPRAPAPAAAGAYPPRSPLPAKGTPTGVSRYSYVSSPPPAGQQPNKLNVQMARADWAPDPTLVPHTQRALCERFYPLAVDRCLTLSVVSVPECQDQKSRVAAEIALALAESGHPRVLLVDGDFYRPQVHRLLRIDMPIGSGFSQQLHARIHGAAPERWTVLSCTSSLHAVAEGMMRSPGLMLSHQFGDAISDMRGYYDFIVIDGPTASLDVDSHAAMAVSDLIVIVRPSEDSPALARVESLFAGKQISYVFV